MLTNPTLHARSPEPPQTAVSGQVQEQQDLCWDRGGCEVLTFRSFRYEYRVLGFGVWGSGFWITIGDTTEA